MMLTLADARALISANITPLRSEAISLDQARQRILRQAACAPDDIPPFDRSAMDGYAVNDSGAPPQFVIVGEIQAGTTPALEIRPGECVRIFTGAKLPDGTTRVLPQENTSRENQTLVPTEPQTRTWIRHRGEDAARGSVLLEEGTRLGPGELSILAGIGLTQPLVVRQPGVIHLATGNELVAPESSPVGAQIRDSNSVLIAGLLSEQGARLIRQERVPDTLEDLITPVTTTPADSWDLLLISGGASVGDFDFGARALRALGFTIHFPKVNLRPGKPLIFATRGQQAAFVIPGNPVSHFVTFHLAIQHALQCFLGLGSELNLIRVPLATALPRMPDSRETWWPAQIGIHDFQLRAFPLPWQSSGDMRGLLGANALLRLPSGCPATAAGSEVECLFLAPPIA